MGLVSCIPPQAEIPMVSGHYYIELAIQTIVDILYLIFVIRNSITGCLQIKLSLVAC